MEDHKKIIKDDVNFLEYPNWVLDRKDSALVEWQIQKERGTYKIISPNGLPKQFDKIVLYFLLYKLYRETRFTKRTITTNRFEIAKSVFNLSKGFGKNKYNRIMDAIRKWSVLSIGFEGLFYTGEEYTERVFHVIESFVLKKNSGELTIHFNEVYIKQLNESKFYKLIDFEQYRKLHKSTSVRLYEVLVKSFINRKTWASDIQLLSEKLTFKKNENAKTYYPSDVLRYLKPAVNEINKKTDLRVSLEYNKETKVCVFTKIEQGKATYKPASKLEDKERRLKQKEEKKAFLKEFKDFSVQEQEEILAEIKRHPFIDFLPDEESRIYAYMVKRQKESTK